MLLLALPLAVAASPGPVGSWDAEVEPIGALPEYIVQLIELASLDPTRLAPDPWRTGPGMRPSLAWNSALGSSPDAAMLGHAALVDAQRMMVSEGLHLDGMGGCSLGPPDHSMLFEQTKALVRRGNLERARVMLPGFYGQPESPVAVHAARLALAVASPEGTFDPIAHAVFYWPQEQLDETSIEVLVDTLVARAAIAHLEYLREPSDPNAVRARQEYEMVLDVLAQVETVDEPPTR